MIESKQEYHSRRERECRAAAGRATDPAIQKCHLYLAKLHREALEYRSEEVFRHARAG